MAKIEHLDKMPEDSPFSGTRIVMGIKPTPAMIARSKRRVEVIKELQSKHPEMPYEAVWKLAAELADKEEAAKREQKKP